MTGCGKKNNRVSTHLVFSTGPLPCIGAEAGERLSSILSRIDALFCQPFAFELFTEDTDSINLDGDGTDEDPLLATLNVSDDDGNILEIRENGAYVPTISPSESIVFVYDNIAALRAANDYLDGVHYAVTKGYYAPNDGGGNTFYYDGTETDTDDNGMVIKPTSNVGNGRWKGIIEDGILNGLKYGMQGQGYAFNNYPAITAALEFIYTRLDITTLYIPPSGITNFYYINDTLVVRNKVKIVGGGTINDTLTRLQGIQNKIVVDYPAFQDNNQANFAYMKDMEITQSFDVTENTNNHGIRVRCPFYFENVSITEADGNGFDLFGEAPSEGNLNLSMMVNCRASFCKNGLHVEGFDANQIRFFSCDFSQNRRWGVYDNGFLGNNYYDPHFATNGTGIAGVNTVVTYGGKYWAASNPEGTPNVNHQPDISPTFWREVGAMSATGAWNSGTDYVSGGTIFIANSNAFGRVEHIYSEGFQPGALYNARTYITKGDDEAGSYGGAWQRTINGEHQLWGSDIFIPKYDVAGSDIRLSNTVGFMQITRASIPNDISYSYLGIGRVGMTSGGLNISWTGNSTGLPNGTPYIGSAGRLGFGNSAPDTTHALASIGGEYPGSNAGSGYVGQTFNKNDIFLNCGLSNDNAESVFGWKVGKNGTVGGTLDKGDFYRIITPIEKQFSTSDDTPFSFFNDGIIDYLTSDFLADFTIEILAVATVTKDIWREKVLITATGTSSLVTIEATEDLVPSIKEGVLAGASYDLDFTPATHTYVLTLTGVAATDINWSVTFTKKLISTT